MSIIKKCKGFRIFDHTADIGIIACGAELSHTYINAAKGMFSIITDLRRVKEKTSHVLSVTAADRETLLVAWLNELIYFCDTAQFLVRRAEISSFSETSLTAIVYGEKVDPSRHSIKIGIKAVTYHLLQVKKTDNGYEAKVIFDI